MFYFIHRATSLSVDDIAFGLAMGRCGNELGTRPSIVLTAATAATTSVMTYFFFGMLLPLLLVMRSSRGVGGFFGSAGDSVGLNLPDPRTPCVVEVE